MNPTVDFIQKIYRLLIGLIVLGFLYVIWPFISSVLVMLVLTFLFTTTLLPGVDFLERKIKSRGLSVLTVTVVVVGVIVTFIGSFIAQLSQQAQEFSGRIDQNQLATEFKKITAGITARLPTWTQQMDLGSGDAAAKLSSIINGILENLGALAETIGSFLITTIMIIIFTIILLHEYHSFKRSLVRFIPNKYFEVGLRLIFNIEHQISSYLRGQLLAASGVAIMSFIGLFILNLEIVADANLTLIVFIGIIAGLANLIPLVGPFVGMIPAILIAIMNNLGPETLDAALAHKLFWVIPSPFYFFDIILMFLIVQQIDNNYVTPKLVGESVGLHPMVVMIALLIGGTLLGPLGMLFAVPAAGIIKVVGQEVTFVIKYAHLL